MSKLRSLKIQIPSRDMTPFITSKTESFSSLENVDISTGSISVPQIKILLVRFPQLRHIVADDSNSYTRIEEGTLWHALGRSFAFAAIERADELESSMKSDSSRLGFPDDMMHPEALRRSRPGRRGLATATISLRNQPQVTPGIQTPATTFSTVSTHTMGPKIRVLPLPANLTSLSINAYAKAQTTQHDEFRTLFIAGWDEGITMLRAVWRRMQTSHMRGTSCVMAPRECKFLAGNGRPHPRDDGEQQKMSTCVNVGSGFDWDGLFAYEWPRPVLCCAGSSDDLNLHVAHCGHFK